MIKYTLFFVAIVSFYDAFSQIEYPCPVNGNAESNNFSNWETFNGTSTNPQNTSSFTSSFSPVNFGIHNSNSTYPPSGPPMLVNGVDQVGNFPVPSEGSYCFSLGNNQGGANAQAMKYTFTVTNDNMYFKIRYALVLQDPGSSHSDGENPAAWFYFINGNEQGVSSSSASYPLIFSTIKYFVADVNNPFYKTNGNVVYRPWECLEFDLSAYVGQSVSFVAISRDCSLGGHYGYMYIDGLCTEWPASAQASLNKTSYCLEETIIMDGSLSNGEDSYFVEVLEVDQSNNPVNGGLEIQEWFVAQQAPQNFDVSNFVTSHSEKLECGKRYKVKLAVQNRCFNWHEDNHYIDIVCPTIDIGEGFEGCCIGEGIVQDFQIGTQSVAGNNYSWSSIPPGFSGNTSYANVFADQNIAYILEMTQPTGCIGRDTFLIRIIPNDFTLEFITEYKLCDYKPYVTANLISLNCQADQTFLEVFGQVDQGAINWYFQPDDTGINNYIGSGLTIQTPNQNGTLSCTYINNECNFTVSNTTQIVYRPGGHGLIAPNTFTPDNGQFNNVFRILEYGPNAPLNIGEGPAYGISDFRLRIWNRWGDNFKTVTKADAGRAPNENVMQGDIFWDGTDNNGVVQDGVYNYSLELKYCGSNSYQRVCLDGSETDVCVRWIWVFCIERISGCTNQVTVIR